MSKLSRVLFFLSALFLAVSLFFPVWRIELDAPQYPEGLCLQIYANKLGGNVDIINGLNHYIGMRTLHVEDFPEFTYLPYIIIFYALLALMTALIKNRKLANGVLIAFILFGIIAMADFWRWEYEYGHDLDPNAAIIVPGMAYQPPLIGFKQLLNFGAYSIPDIGGWMFLISGMLMLVAVIRDRFLLKKHIKNTVMIGSYCCFFLLISCQSEGPQPVLMNKESCTHCKMIIADPRFATQFITQKGRCYKFDDAGCMKNFLQDNKDFEVRQIYFADYLPPHSFMTKENAKFLYSENLQTPMNGNLAAFSDIKGLEAAKNKFHARSISWDEFCR